MDTVAAGRETRELGKASHRGHGGHRGGLRLCGKLLPVDTVAAGRESREWGKHRTEVTEVTEGGLGLCDEAFGGHRGFWARTTRIGESIAQRSRRSQRGDWVGRRDALVDTVASGRETRELGKASHRGHGGHRGGIGACGWKLLVDAVASGREPRELRKASHRGHGGVTEGLCERGFGRGHRGLSCEKSRERETIAQDSRIPKAGKTGLSHHNLSEMPYPISPFCGLCAMLSPFRVSPPIRRFTGELHSSLQLAVQIAVLTKAFGDARG